MKRTLPALALALAALAAACDADAPDTLSELRGAFPDETTLAVTMPDDDSVEAVSAGLAVQEAALVGELSLFRNQARLARRFLTKAIVELLDAFHELTALRPKVNRDGRVVWFARTSAGLESLLVAARKDDGHFVFTAWVRERPDRTQRVAWRFLAYGSLTPGATLGDGRGALWVDLNNDRKPQTQGKLVVLYSEDGDVRDLDVRAFDAVTEGSERVTRGYRFHQDGAVGVFAFDGGLVDIHKNPAKAALERVRFAVRWDAAKRVRTDRVATGDEVAAEGFRAVVDTECWQAKEGIVLFGSRVAFPLGNGAPVVVSEAGAPGLCPFGAPGPAALPEPAATPSAPDAPPETDPTLDWER